MKADEESNIISKAENESIPLTNKTICKHYKDKPKISSNRKIIFIGISIILLVTIILCILYYLRENKSDLDNNDYKYPLYEKNKGKKEDIESLKDLREKIKEIDNDDDNKEGKDVNQPLNEKKDGKLFDDEDNADNKNDNEEPMLQRNKTREIKKDQLTEKEVINNKRKDLKPNEKKNIFGDEDNNDDGEKSENKNQTNKVFDEKDEGNNDEQEPVIQEKQLNKTRIENSDDNNHEFKHDKEDEDNMDNDNENEDDEHKKEEKPKDIKDKLIRRLNYLGKKRFNY